MKTTNSIHNDHGDRYAILVPNENQQLQSFFHHMKMIGFVLFDCLKRDRIKYPL